MIAIGERINGMFTDVKQAIAEKDKAVIQDLAKRQTECGASYLDVNVGTAAADQEGAMAWLVETIQETCKTPLCLDSQKPNVIAAGLKAADTSMGILLNSSPLNKKNDAEVLDKFIEMAQSAGPEGKIIALTMDKNGVPQDVDTRVAIAAEIVEKAMGAGFEMHRLFVDPIVLPVKVPDAQQQPTNIIAAIGQIVLLSDPPPHIVVGLSNLSQGAGERSLINRTFLVMAASHGLDAAIVDVLDEQLVDAMATGEMLLNKQLYSDSYLKAYRNA
ncbi:MAG: methyltetrahydrofolate--corrinoid methyltransferase [Planctomycetota bacterium]|nr:MAG: methyltetrahydrofolate--corrinoid methyltransferase [Planctomycetota bacterium]